MQVFKHASVIYFLILTDKSFAVCFSTNLLSRHSLMTKKSQPAAGGTNICSFEALHFGDDGRSVQGGKWEYGRVKKKKKIWIADANDYKSVIKLRCCFRVALSEVQGLP